MAEISKTADQALALLLAVTESGPRTPAQLARDLQMNRTVVHRLLSTLHKRGLVLRQDGGYLPGTVLVSLAMHVQPELRMLGRPSMLRLAEAMGESVVLHVRDGLEAVVLEQVVSDVHVVRVQHKVESRHALMAGASGRAILAFLDETTVDLVLRHVENSVAVQRQLDGIRLLGYALSHDELQPGVHGVAVPIFDRPDHVIASMAILVPTDRAGDLSRHADALLGVCAELSGALYCG